MMLKGTGVVRIAFACAVKLEDPREGLASSRATYPEAGAVGVGPQQAEPISGLELAADGKGDQGRVVPGDEVLEAEG